MMQYIYFGSENYDLLVGLVKIFGFDEMIQLMMIIFSVV